MKKSKVIFPKKYKTKIKDKKKQRIYDCFTFAKELDLLEIRLKELYDHVDYFVLVEATKTFSEKPKELAYLKNKSRFKKWNDKIIHVIVDDMPHLYFYDHFLIWLEKKLPRKPQLFLRKFLARIVGGVARYKMIEFQRRCILRGLKYANEEDIILGVDVDEIPNKKTIHKVTSLLKHKKYVEFEQTNFRYFLNGKVSGEDGMNYGTRACLCKTLMNELDGNIDFLRTTPYFWRKFNNKEYGRHNYGHIHNGGWHFSYIGDLKSIMEKFTNVSHPEADRDELKDPTFVQKMIDTGEIALSNSKVTYVKITKDFPTTIYLNKNYYKKKGLIK